MHANRAIYHEGWLAGQRSGFVPWPSGNSKTPPAWELYDLSRDFSQARDIAGAHPQKLADLQRLFDEEAAKEALSALPIAEQARALAIGKTAKYLFMAWATAHYPTRIMRYH